MIFCVIDVLSVCILRLRIERRKIMSIYPWIEKIDFQKFAMPLVVKRDNEYYPGIVEKLANLVFELERCGASDKIVLAVKEYRKKIISSIILYYQGDRSFSSFLQISSNSFLYSLQEDVSYSVGSMLPYQNSSRILIRHPPRRSFHEGRFPQLGCGCCS